MLKCAKVGILLRLCFCHLIARMNQTIRLGVTVTDIHMRKNLKKLPLNMPTLLLVFDSKVDVGPDDPLQSHVRAYQYRVSQFRKFNFRLLAIARKECQSCTFARAAGRNSCRTLGAGQWTGTGRLDTKHGSIRK